MSLIRVVTLVTSRRYAIHSESEAAADRVVNWLATEASHPTTISRSTISDGGTLVSILALDRATTLAIPEEPRELIE